MKTQLSLPTNYEELFSVDLKNNKRLMLLVNGFALIIAAVAVAIGMLFVPIASLFDLSNGLLPYCLRFGVLLVGSVVYIVLHELVHGVFIWCFSRQKPFYGYEGIYAYAGSHAYFSKWHYFVIALSPVVIWGVVLAIACPLVPEVWFWVLYFIQIFNLSGAAGDLYVFFKFLRLPRDILVRDVGTAMTVYVPKAPKETEQA